jgi:hypothetical protein
MRDLLLTRLKRRRHRSGDETGAILILALVFMVVTALLITGLSAWESNDINNIGTLKSGRSGLYAADGAIQIAVANTRYVYPANTTPGFCPGTSPATVPSIDGQQVPVWCAMTVNPATCPISSCSRIEILSAYPGCSSAPCTGTPYVQQEVIFNDNTSNPSFNDCNPAGAKTTCGSSMTVYGDVVGAATT